MGKTHTTIGLGAAVTAAIVLDLSASMSMVFLTGSVVGSLAPDIDHSKSKWGKLIHNKMNLIVIGAIGYGLYQMPELRVIIKITGVILGLILFSGHRKFTHSILSVVLLTLLIQHFKESGSTLFWLFSRGLTLGYCLHIAADCLTERSVQLSWPLPNLKVALKLFSTDGLREKMLFSVLSVYLTLSMCFLVAKNAV